MMAAIILLTAALFVWPSQSTPIPTDVAVVYDPYYQQVTISWVQHSTATAVLVGKFDSSPARAWTRIYVVENSGPGPHRVIDYAPRQGDAYALAECYPTATPSVNECRYVDQGRQALLYQQRLPFILSTPWQAASTSSVEAQITT